MSQLDLDPRFVAVVLVQRFKHLRRAGVPVEQTTDDEVFEVFRLHSQGRVSREGVSEVLRLLASEPVAVEPDGDRVAAVFVNRRITPLTDEEIHHVVRQHLNSLVDRNFATPAQKARHLIGRIMRQYLGCIEGRRLVAFVCNKLQLPPSGLLETAPKATPERNPTVGVVSQPL